METIKKPQAILIYNDKDITLDISKYLISLSYSDYEKDQSDELSITLNDKENLFKTAWKPQKGDKIAAKIGYLGEELLNCGSFTVDENEMSLSDGGNIVTIRALAASINDKIREKNSKAYENKLLVDIAKEIGKKHNFRVVGSEGFIKIQRATQYNESDLSFLRRISAEYGYIFKLCDNLLVFTQIDTLEKTEPLTTLTLKDISTVSLRDTSTKTYTSCRVQYFNAKTGKYQSVTVKGDRQDVKKEVLKLNVKCQNKEEAITKAKAGLKTGQNTIEGSLTLKSGNRYFIAGANFTMTDGLGFYGGKFHIKSSTHEITHDNYTCSGEVYKIA